jgi:hypothetical protein
MMIANACGGRTISDSLTLDSGLPGQPATGSVLPPTTAGGPTSSGPNGGSEPPASTIGPTNLDDSGLADSTMGGGEEGLPPSTADVGPVVDAASVMDANDDQGPPYETYLDGATPYWCPGDAQALPICVEYFASLSVCTGRDSLSWACQESLLPGEPDADIPMITQLCASNLQRLHVACQ